MQHLINYPFSSSSPTYYSQVRQSQAKSKVTLGSDGEIRSSDSTKEDMMDLVHTEKISTAKNKLEKWQKQYGKVYVKGAHAKRTNKLLESRERRLQAESETKRRHKQWLVTIALVSRCRMFEVRFVRDSQTHHRFKALFGELMFLKLQIRCWVRRRAADRAREFLRDFITKDMVS
jgi:hypothetical protein